MELLSTSINKESYWQSIPFLWTLSDYTLYLGGLFLYKLLLRTEQVKEVRIGRIPWENYITLTLTYNS